ncbi:MAG: glucose-6-phosphate dehydrogenase assembly protein OpcA [Solirubrobacteraceae bacterium]
MEDDLSATAVSDAVWSAQDTTPGAIESALSKLVADRHRENDSYVAARALNLVCIVDEQFSGEIANRLRHVGRYHASRTVVCSVAPGRRTIDARATVASEAHPQPGEFSIMRETVVVSVGERHLPHLAQIVDPLVVTDLATVVWSPHGHREAVDSLVAPAGGARPVAQCILLDSAGEPDQRGALDRVCTLAAQADVVDLGWLRTTPWRERVAAHYDPADRRAELRTISKVSVRHGSDSLVSGMLLIGWLCDRLGWRSEQLTRHGDLLRGRARSRRGEVQLRLEPVEGMRAPGLSGLEIRSDRGTVLNLERGEGGLTARRTERSGSERSWTVLGASRGEPGILGEGIRHTLLPDATYAPALAAARSMLA